MKELCEIFSIGKMAEYKNMDGLCEAIDLLYKDVGNQISWKDVLGILREYTTEFGGFNIFPDELADYDEFLALKCNISDALAGKKPLVRRICMDCHNTFYMYRSERDFFATKGFSIPKRCKDCRKKRRLERLKEMG